MRIRSSASRADSLQQRRTFVAVVPRQPERPSGDVSPAEPTAATIPRRDPADELTVRSSAGRAALRAQVRCPLAMGPARSVRQLHRSDWARVF